MANVRDVAKYFIHLSDESPLYAITPLKLQKLVYYAQGYHLRDTGKPLFKEDLLAWDHGPVVRKLYDDYKHLGYFTIAHEPFEDFEEKLNRKESKTIREVREKYGRLDGKFLEELTHQEDPWLYTGRNGVIDTDVIKKYFTRQLALSH
ncbi:hypothetical protein BW899_06625 [Bacillus mycoides]|uniref:Panacea domain-containing protein n=1 Tax=Bacillus TaxID=1386 RepID=UPI00099414C2|nr:MULTISPECIES: type II toxin-antitoxin system antitoxin SocA domain-containing protein [Bacillus cereus group]OOR01637.1 hypothetical protein BW899_06625 [Bacillus mycoides]QQU31683.1 SocA family protein [Bacillus cereus]HDR7585532.1 SocA family protein [Bacillus mycoides]